MPAIQFKVETKLSGNRLDVYLSELQAGSRSQIKHWIEDELVKVNGTLCTKPAQKIREGDVIEVQQIEPKTLDLTPQKLDGVKLLYEDDDLAVFNKPSGIAVHPSDTDDDPTLVHAALHELKSLSSIGGVSRPGIVNRIDKGTSGLLVVSKNDRTHMHLSRQFKEHTIDRKYHALVYGWPVKESGRIETFFGRHPKDRKKMTGKVSQGRNAVTHWQVLERFANHMALMECKLETGRTHQIRVHLSEMGHTVVGDPVYGTHLMQARKQEFAKELMALDHQLLHARSLGFTHPTTGKKLFFEGDLPQDFLDILALVRKKESR